MPLKVEITPVSIYASHKTRVAVFAKHNKIQKHELTRNYLFRDLYAVLKDNRRKNR